MNLGRNERNTCVQVECCTSWVAKSRERELQSDIAAENHLRESTRKSWAAAHGPAARDVLVAVVAGNGRRLVAKSKLRVDHLRNHLQSLVDSAQKAQTANSIAPTNAGEKPLTDQAKVGSPADERVQATLLRACTVCRGACCTAAGNQAYLTLETLVRSGALAEVSLQSLVNNYVAHVPAQSYEKSCIFHGPTGCGLTPEMRSDTCNAHLCRGLRRLRRELRDGGSAPIVVVISEEESGPQLI